MSLFDRLTALQRSLIGAVAGLFFYGTWAFAVNLQHGQWAALKAACVQGGYSFVLTFFMTMLLEALFRLMTKTFSHQGVVNWLTVVVACSVVFSGSWIVNVAAGTPEVLRTVILGYIVGGFYSVSYVLGLSKTGAGQG